MKVRLAALITTCAAALLWYSEPLKSEDLAGVCISDNSDPAEAIAACTTLIESDDVAHDQRHLFFAERAEAFHRNKKYDRSIEDADRALAYYPERARTLVWRAFAHYVQGDQQAADADFAQALQINENDIYVLYNKARLHRKRGEIDVSESGYKQVLQLDPDHQDAAKDLINLTLEQGENARVESLLRDARKRWPLEDWVYLYQVVYDLKYSGDIDNARTVAEAWRKALPTASLGPFYLALIHFQLGNEAQGISNVRSFAALNVEEGHEQLEFFERWIRIISSHLVLGQDEQWLVRFVFYAGMGQADLALAEAHAFLKQTGKNGREILLRLIRTQGVEVPPQADAGSVEGLNKAIADYIEDVRVNSGLSTYASPKSQGI